MGDPLAKVSPASPLVIPAGAYNLFVDAARQFRDTKEGRTGGGPNSDPIRPATHAYFKNPASAASDPLPAFSVVGYGSPIIDPAAGFSERVSAGRTPAFYLNTPGAASSPIAITTEPIEGQGIGRAVTAGIAVCKVIVSNAAHSRAVPIAGDSARLASAAVGGYPVLYKAGSSGEVWGMILLPGDSAEDCEPFGAHAPISNASGYNPNAGLDFVHPGSAFSIGSISWMRTDASFVLPSPGLYQLTAWINLAMIFTGDLAFNHGGGEIALAIGPHNVGPPTAVVPASRRQVGSAIRAYSAAAGSTPAQIVYDWSPLTTTPYYFAGPNKVRVDVVYRTNTTSEITTPQPYGQVGYSWSRSGACGSFTSPPPPPVGCQLCDLLGKTATLTVDDGPKAGTYTTVWVLNNSDSYAFFDLGKGDSLTVWCDAAGDVHYSPSPGGTGIASYNCGQIDIPCVLSILGCTSTAKVETP